MNIHPELEKKLTELGYPVGDYLLEYCKYHKRVPLIHKQYELRFYLVGNKRIKETVFYFNTMEEAVDKSHILFIKAEKKRKDCEYSIVDRDTNRTIFKY